MADSDCQTDERRCQNFRENAEKKENGVFREMMILLKSNINNLICIICFFLN